MPEPEDTFNATVRASFFRPPSSKDMYRGVVEGVKTENPNLGHLSTDLVMKMMEVESTYNPLARSRKDARGLMQVKPDTAAWIRGKMGLEEDVDLYDPEQNVQTGMLYFNYLMDLYKGDTEKALHAYNVGPTNFQKGVRNRKYVRKILGRK